MTGEPYAGKPPVRFGGRGGPQGPFLPLSRLSALARWALVGGAIHRAAFHRATFGSDSAGNSIT